MENLTDLLNHSKQLIEQRKFREAIAVLVQIIPVYEQNEDWFNYTACLLMHSDCLQQIHQYEDSFNIAQLSLNFCLEHFGLHHLQTANSYYYLGITSQKYGTIEDTIHLFEQALSIFTLFPDEPNHLFSRCLNSLGICYAKQSKYALAIEFFNKTLDIDSVQFSADAAIHAKTYSNLGICYRYLGEYKTAIDLLNKAVNIETFYFGEVSPGLGKYYHNLSTSYIDYGDYSKAIHYLQKSLENDLKLYDKSDFRFSRIYNNLGNCYQKTSDYESAVQCYLHNLSIAAYTGQLSHIEISTCYFNLGTCFVSMRRYKEATFYLNKTLDFRLKVFGELNAQTAQGYHGLGNLYFSVQNMEKAYEYFKKAFDIRLSVFGKVNNDTAISYLCLGNWYKLTGRFKEAFEHYEEMLYINLSLFGEINPVTARSYVVIASCYSQVKNFAKALEHVQKALFSLGLTGSKHKVCLLPRLEHYNSRIYCFEMLVLKANIFHDLFLEASKFVDLAASLAHFYHADCLIDQTRQSYKLEGSKLVLAGKSKTEIYDEGMETAWFAEQVFNNTGPEEFTRLIKEVNFNYQYSLPEQPVQTAFYFSEKSKAIVLLSGIKDNQAKINAGLPEQMREQEMNLRLELARLEHQLREAKSKPEEQQDFSVTLNWDLELFDLKEQYQHLIEDIETRFPDYYRLKHDLTVTDIEAVQAALSPQTAMISYVVSENHLYSIVITSDSANWLQQQLPAGFEDMVEDLLYSFEPFGKEDYITYAFDLYRILIQPMEELGWLDFIHQLIIIPDGILSRIPFEALLTQTVKDTVPYRKLNYLLHRYIIRYHYSATLWLGQQTVSDILPPTIQNFLGFAPVYADSLRSDTETDIELNVDYELLTQLGLEFDKTTQKIHYIEADSIVRGTVDGKDYAELLHSETEVRQSGKAYAENGLDARILLHQSATLNNFKALAGQYRYILIAAHADVDDENPEKTGIIFSPNKEDGKGIFYMSDAYNLKLNAEVVVLSCCETGLGKINKGEGTMALNRGFLYAGASNVVYTLFKVYDKESCELTTLFFHHLLNNPRCAEALHHAKLHIIEKGGMPLKWAGYVLLGT
ncbi:MAG: CHAT domain-containing protein [Sphingobacteriales bacterium]|nr:MAG: CHAT domain-containing protein [Sphingobacteriales bacterium]